MTVSSVTSEPENLNKAEAAHTSRYQPPPSSGCPPKCFKTPPPPSHNANDCSSNEKITYQSISCFIRTCRTLLWLRESTSRKIYKDSAIRQRRSRPQYRSGKRVIYFLRRELGKAERNRFGNSAHGCPGSSPTREKIEECFHSLSRVLANNVPWEDKTHIT